MTAERGVRPMDGSKDKNAISQYYSQMMHAIRNGMFYEKHEEERPRSIIHNDEDLRYELCP